MSDNCVMESATGAQVGGGDPKCRSGFRPNVDILEGADEFVVRADLPGATAQSVDIQFEKGVLSLRAAVARRDQPGAAQLVREYGVGGFAREFRIGEGIDTARVTAECANGVLTLHLPKSEMSKPRKIDVK